MRAARFSAGGAIVLDEAPRPQPGRSEVLVRVCAAGAIPSELEWYPTTHTEGGGHRTGAVPCHEFSGVVEAVSEGVEGISIGAEVYGMNGWFADGALADYCVAPVSAIAPKPARLSHSEAAAAPISGLTAWQGLFDRAHLRPGERVLVHGGAGGVGVFAVQLARWRGADVAATASAKNATLVAELGARQVIDSRAVPFESVISETDVIFDTAGGDVLERSWSVLKPGGRLITIVASAEGSTDPRVQNVFFIVEPNRDQLVRLSDLLDRGELRSIVDSVLPFSAAPAAYNGSFHRQGRGKVVIAIGES